VTMILAAVDASAAAQPVLDTATALGRTLRLPVVAIHVRQDGTEAERLLTERAGIELRLTTGTPAEAIVAALDHADVALAVVGVRGHPAGRRPAGSTALAVATSAAKPVVVVPPEPRDPPPAGLHRVLVPLDGTADTARAVEQTMSWFAGSGVEIVSLHVFDATTVPRFWDGRSMTTPPGRASSWPATPRWPVPASRCAAAGRPTGSWRWRARSGPT
jgi:nucleotide-binding universal stress UspA family protein